MNVGELRESLAKLDRDMDTSEIFLVFEKGGKRDFDLLAATGYVPVDGVAYFALVSLKAMNAK